MRCDAMNQGTTCDDGKDKEKTYRKSVSDRTDKVRIEEALNVEKKGEGE